MVVLPPVGDGCAARHGDHQGSGIPVLEQSPFYQRGNEEQFDAAGPSLATEPLREADPHAADLRAPAVFGTPSRYVGGSVCGLAVIVDLFGLVHSFFRDVKFSLRKSRPQKWPPRSHDERWAGLPERENVVHKEDGGTHSKTYRRHRRRQRETLSLSKFCGLGRHWRFTAW